MKILECVPNVSEGRDQNILDALATSIRKVKNVKLLHVDAGYAANRTVFTFAGEPQAVTEAVYNLYEKCFELIDMSRHLGTHPRQAAVDVCPLVPLRGISMEETVDLSYQLGRKIGANLGIPGYYYEYSASIPERKNLAVLRKGEYESLPKKFTLLPPDFGNPENWQRNGVTVLGARNILIAYNVNLNTTDAAVAHEIAEKIRESGKIMLGRRRTKKRIFGRLKTVKGLGWYMEDFKKAQVSYNLTNIDVAGMLEVFVATCEEAAKLGYKVSGSELIGLAPKKEFIKAGKYFARQKSIQASSEKEIIDIAISALGLDELKPFDPNDKIIELMVNG